MESLINIDYQTLLWFNHGFGHPHWLDVAMTQISSKWFWVPLYAVIVAWMFWALKWRKTLLALVAVALTITLSDQLCATWIRPAVERLRPVAEGHPLHEQIVTVFGYAPGSYSFPSCHAANTFALATLLTLVMRRRWFGRSIFAWATVVSVSRLYLGVHHPSDIIAGAAIGCLIAAGVYWLLRRTYRWLGLVALLCLPLGATAQEVKSEWSVDFQSVFDNREGNARYTPTETFFFTQLSPEVGLSLMDGMHRVMGGVTWTQPVGCEWDGHRVSPILYYRYHTSRWRMSMGMFPRTQLIRELPNYLESDSVRYFQHTFRGAIMQLQGAGGSFFEAVIDWRGMQSKTRREAFSIIAQGEWCRGVFVAGGTAMLNHLAKQKNPPADQYVIDNLMFNPRVGINATGHVAPLDSLSLRVGVLGSLTRDRAIGAWHTPVGLWADLCAEWWRLGIKSTLYVGSKPLFPLHGRFGSVLNEGEPFYSSSYYSRTNIYGHILRYKFVTLDASMDFNVARECFIFYQKLTLKFKI